MLRLVLRSLSVLIAAGARAETADVVIYGATPAGIFAAVAAARDGRSVLLAEPTHRIGGMVTNGLVHPDFRAFEAITGAYLKLTRLTTAYYVEKYGADSQQVKDTLRGTHAEPKVNLLLFQRMLAEHPRITVRTQWTLLDARTRGPAGNRWIHVAQFRDATGKEHRSEGKIFIDATYEGDLIAAAQVDYRVGVESQDEYGESAAPEHGGGDLQGYNFRFTMTKDPAIRVMPSEPKGYRREIFSGLLDLIAAGKIKGAFGGYVPSDVIKAVIPVLPNGKSDINDVSRGEVRLSLPGDQLLWPEGDAAVRKRIYDEHVLWNVGLIYFMQNDPVVPRAIQEGARAWGWCKDEYEENGHIPPQLYVREARRLVGQRIYTQNDTRHAEGDARAVLHRDSIAMGDYGHSSHGTRHEGPRFGGKRLGESPGVVYAPYQIPYGTMVPRDVRNLLAPVPVSASHIGFCALRLEPIWSSLGQAAGHAAHLALQAAIPDVRSVAVPKLQRRLHTAGSATIYVHDVLPGHAEFAAVQWWGTTGGLHGLGPKPAGPLRGKTIVGQYSEGWFNHSADLGRVLDSEVASRWLKVARDAGVAVDALPKADGRTTRGAWIAAAFKASMK